MKILMLTPRCPHPPDRGDRLRSWSELDFLTRRHDVWLASADERPPDDQSLAVLRQRCRNVAVFVRPAWRSLARGIFGFLGGRSLTSGFFYNRRLARRVRTWSQQIGFDALLTYSSAMVPYADLVSATRRVLDMVDVDSVKWRVYAARSRSLLRAFYVREAKRLAIVERRGAGRHDVCLVVNERERRKLLERTYPRQTGVLRTCVDVAQYTCLNPAKACSPVPHEPIIGTIGSMFYPPNVRAVNWFGRYVWPLVQTARPDAQWLIVGSRPTRAVRRWGRLPGITVTGYVPDVLPYLTRTRVFVSPVESELGTQSKVIVAMAAGKPVVITPDGAAGIDYDGRAPFLIAGSPRGFADAVVRLLHDDALALDLIERGRRVVDANYRAETQLPQLECWLQPEPVGVGRHHTPTEAPAAKPPAPAASSTRRATHEVAG